MRDTLRRICGDSGRLIGVDYTLFEGSSAFVTAVGLRFEALVAVFRACAEDDTLVAGAGTLLPAADETLAQMGHSLPWSTCMGLGVSWAWNWTNQQGYNDGVRLEFSEPGKASQTVVELLVIASAIKVFVATEAGH